MTDLRDGLTGWFAERLPEVDDVSVEGLDRVAVGHSAETLLLTLVCDGRHRDVVVRIRPPEPGLLEPYDLGRQFRILQALDDTPVRAPRALWYEPGEHVLGRDFYVMERMPGLVYERGVPDEVAGDRHRVRRMCEGIVDQLAAIHTVDLTATGLLAIDDGRTFLDRELTHWSNEIERVQRGPLPALERLVQELHATQPDPCPTVTLVHGDPKPGNVAFDGADVTAVFDWELATVGDPLADLGYLQVNWTLPGNITSTPGALRADELGVRWSERTGIEVRDLPWYRALARLKLAAILLVAGHLYDSGHSDDPRFGQLPRAVPLMTDPGLRELDVDEPLDHGAYLPTRQP